MRIATIAAALVLATAGSANAAQIYFNNFDAENVDGSSALNYAGFSGITVTTGSVDLVKHPEFGISCAGDTGSCVDLQGSTGQDSRLTLGSFAFAANTLYTFTFDLSGDQRNGGADEWFVGVDYGANNVYNFFRLGGGFGNFDVLQGAGTSGSSTGGIAQSSDGFQTYSIGFSLQNAGTASFYIGSNTAGDAGPIVDNFDVTSAGVPEPATWAMMIAGFGMSGAMIRRRRVAFSRA